MRTAEKTNENETASDGERECRAGRKERGKRKQKINELRTHEKLGQNKSLNGSKMVLIFSWWRRTPRPSLPCPVRLVPVAVAVAVPLPHLVAPCCRPAAPLVVKICCAPRRFPRGILKPSSALHLRFLCVCDCVCVSVCASLTPCLSLPLPLSLCRLLCVCFALRCLAASSFLFYFIQYNSSPCPASVLHTPPPFHHASTTCPTPPPCPVCIRSATPHTQYHLRPLLLLLRLFFGNKLFCQCRRVVFALQRSKGG